MKKILAAALGAIFITLGAVGFTACGNSDDGISVYMPDGAPALALAQHMIYGAEFGKDVNYNVVDSSVIHSFVTGANPAADLCVLPVNMASKLLGNAENYQMLGTVTHGNLFILKKQGAGNITAENLTTLIGKTVGVIMLSSAPGLTFKLILNNGGLQFNELTDGGKVADDKVNLKAVTSAEVLPTNSECDYFIVPEPAATTKVNATGGKLDFAGSLQELYGEGNGYPQAVLVAKKSLILSDKALISNFTGTLNLNSDWLKGEYIGNYIGDIVSAINSHMAKGSASSLNVNNLNRQVIGNCAIKFVNAKECKNSVNAFISKLIEINPDAASVVSDDFYYTVNA